MILCALTLLLFALLPVSSSANVILHPSEPTIPNGQTLVPMVQQPGSKFQFLAGTGSANRVIGNIVPAAIFPATPAFSGSWLISGGTDAGKFKINSSTGVVSVCNTSPSCTDLPAGNYSITISVSQPNIVGSPVATPVTLQGVDVTDTTTLYLALDNYMPTPGSTIHATVRNTPNASGTDYVMVGMKYPREYSNFNTSIYQPHVGSAGTHNATVTITVPNPPTDNYQFLFVSLVPNGGQPSAATAVTSGVLVAPSLTPSALSFANNLSPPFTPTQMLTVCPSGCQYTNLSSAVIGLSNNNHANTLDNILIQIRPGTYEDCINFGNSDPFTPPTNDNLWHLPQHLWIQGVGGTQPRLEGMLNPSFLCQSKGLIVFWGGTNDVLTVENLEIADWSTAAPTGGVYAGSGHITLVNDYIHDGEMCFLTGATGSFNYTMNQVHLARCGETTGPAHDVYFGGGANVVNIDHSLVEQALAGDEMKSRASQTNLLCNQWRGSQDAYYVDSEELDFAEGRWATITNDVIVKGAGSSTQNNIGWGMDVADGFPPISGVTWSLTLNSVTIINDEPARQHWAVYIGPYNSGSGGQPTMMSSPPDPWANNVFVDKAYGTADPNGAYPYLSWRIFNTPPSYPDTTQVTESNDLSYASRAAAGITQQYPLPPCVNPPGNLVVPAKPTLTVTFNPPNPSISDTTPIGTVVSTVVPTWSNGIPYTGLAPVFANPFGNDSGRFAIVGNNIVVNADLSAFGNSTRNVTAQAQQ